MKSAPLNPAPGVFTAWRGHWSSQLAGSDYYAFRTRAGLEGLARVAGGALEVLAVGTRTPGRGRFRAFIAAAKAQFATITIWEVWAPELVPVLARYGFSPCTGASLTLEGRPAAIRGFRWQR